MRVWFRDYRGEDIQIFTKEATRLSQIFIRESR